MIGLGANHTIWLDANAAGWGRFVDPTPADDREFPSPGNQGEGNRMDLLTVLEHETGHLLGYDHGAGGVMQETLTAATRLSVSPGEHADLTRLASDAVFGLLAADEGMPGIGTGIVGPGRKHT
ncbi:MAG: hypothetical protein HYS12_29090 [Planctomycetes bacterium]|nr:hypothetical protein [Planctomycetota bacterium]